jgi:hypothetical protein
LEGKLLKSKCFGRPRKWEDTVEINVVEVVRIENR